MGSLDLPAVAWLVFVAAALLEVGGDAVIRQGLRGGGWAFVAAGAVMLGGYGIVVNVDGVTVKGNKISGPVYGIDMNCHTGTVSGNTISFTEYGISATAGSIGVNTFYNTASKTSTC